MKNGKRNTLDGSHFAETPGYVLQFYFTNVFHLHPAEPNLNAAWNAKTKSNCVRRPRASLCRFTTINWQPRDYGVLKPAASQLASSVTDPSPFK